MKVTDQAEKLKLRELRILLAVAKAGSMVKGAADLGISQPNVSKAISDLEYAFGVRLLDRSPHGVEPTSCGVALIRRATAAFGELRHAVNDVAFLADPTSGELRLGCTDFVAGTVGGVLDRMSRQYPRIKFHVMSADATTLQHEVRSRNIEFLVGPTESVDADDMQMEVLYDDPIVVVADAQHPLVRRRKIQLGELVNEAWTLPPANTPAGSSVLDAFHANGLDCPNSVVSTYSIPLRHYLVATARFITVLPESMLRVMERRLSLKALPVHLPASRRPIALIVLKNRTLSPIAQLFIETIRAVAKPQTKATKCAP